MEPIKPIALIRHFRSGHFNPPIGNVPGSRRQYSGTG